MNTTAQFYEKPWFFAVMMIILFMVSYGFRGVIFGKSRHSSGPLPQGLHNTINNSQLQQNNSQRGGFGGGSGGPQRGFGGSSQGGGGNTNGSSRTMTR